MEDFLKTLIFAGIAWLAFVILAAGKRIRGNPLGTPPVGKPALLLAKLGAALSFLLLILKAVSGSSQLTMSASVIFVCLWAAGSLIFTMGMLRLGQSLRMGLPQEETALIRSGIYNFSRNPIYLGMYLLMGASLAYAFSWLNLAAVTTSVVLHHRIVLAEERFLLSQFEEYEGYRSTVGRYWGRRSTRR
jgi:protein-S-isoprenylcysteine O-methyltransferase Ste14